MTVTQHMPPNHRRIQGMQQDIKLAVGYKTLPKGPKICQHEMQHARMRNWIHFDLVCTH